MTRRIALERFGEYLPDPTLGPGSREPVASPAAAMAGRPSGNPPDHADDNPGDLPADDASPRDERRVSLARIAAALDIIAAEQAELRARLIGDAVGALGAAAETLLPRLARAGFAALVAETAQTVARRGQWPELQLSLAPGDTEAVAAALEISGAAAGIKIAEDPALEAGEARLEWDRGGAEIDIDAIVTATLEQFRRQLEASAQLGA